MKNWRGILTSLRTRVIISMTLVLIICMGVLFYIIENTQEDLLFKQVESQARILFKQIVLTRKWIADHGGIFVEKLPWVKANPYLKDRFIVDITGKKYIKENPAYVTRQLAEYSRKEGLYWFRITSLNLINPANKPDEFERKALVAIENEGLTEVSTIVTEGDQKYYRYVAPLYVEPSCLNCHKGYSIGAVRGAISITLPINHIIERIKRQRIFLIGGGLITICLLVGMLYIALDIMVLSPVERLRKNMAEFEKSKDRKIKPPSTRELADLYSSFQQLIEKLTGYQQNLEKEIQKATASLKETNEKLLETTEKYKNLSQRKSEFITYLSHELRTPLTAVKGALDYISARVNQLKSICSHRCDLSEIESFSELASNNIERLNRLVTMALDLEKIELGQVEFNFSTLDLSRKLNDLCMEVLPLFEDKRLKLNADIENNLLVRADEDRIIQVAFNLILNAVEHSPEEGTITIDGYRSGRWVIFRVIDEGPGVPFEKQSLIFEKFYKERKKGTGLGLAISKAIVEAHSGEIGVVSDGKKGSTFYVKLPASDETYDIDS